MSRGAASQRLCISTYSHRAIADELSRSCLTAALHQYELAQRPGYFLVAELPYSSSASVRRKFVPAPLTFGRGVALQQLCISTVRLHESVRLGRGVALQQLCISTSVSGCCHGHRIGSRSCLTAALHQYAALDEL